MGVRLRASALLPPRRFLEFGGGRPASAKNLMPGRQNLHFDGWKEDVRDLTSFDCVTPAGGP